MANSMSAGGSSALAGNENVQQIFVVGVQNAHALEKQAIQLLERQVERITNYPEMAQRLRQHIAETKEQEERLDRILDQLGSSRSALKDWVTQLMGNAAAVAHVPMADEILKDTFANNAFENFEIAAYKSLITITEAAGQSRFVSGFQQTLREEEAMARFIFDNVEMITRKYLSLEASGQKADR